MALLVVADRAMGSIAAWVPGASEAAKRGALAAAVPTLKQDHRALAMNALRQLELAKVIEQRARLGAVYRVSSFKFC